MPRIIGTESFIRNNSSVLGHQSAARSNVKLPSRRQSRRFFANFTRSRKRLIRFSLVSVNLALLGLAWFVVSRAPSNHSPLQLNANASPLSQATITGPLDQVSSADIAVHIARVVGLPEATSVTNHADSVSAAANTGPVNNAIVAKPQVAGGVLPTYRDIQRYTTVPGDTVASIATKLGVSSDSIRWSNNLTGSNIGAGRNIVVPPSGLSGFVYTVSSGDTPEKLAQRFSANKDAIIDINDADVAGLKVGTQILIPDGSVRPAAVARVVYTFFGNANGYYDRGWCTDYASAKGGAPGGWGNANTWAYFAARTPGWTVSKTPQVGAIAQTRRGSQGHVGIVDDVRTNPETGALEIKYSDMNGLAGWGRVGYSDWVPAHAKYENFIYRQ